jgi:hypothetical protein
MGFTRLVAVIVLLIGVASLGLGVMFVIQGNDGRNDLTTEISPLPLNQIDARYDAVKAMIAPLAAAEEPNIQAGKALPSANYSYLSAQRTSLSVARTNNGLTTFIMTSGYVILGMGVGLVLVGGVLFAKVKV